MVVGLIIILLLVLLGPFLIKKVEHNLEIFLFTMGLLATIVSRSLHLELIEEALREPIMITIAVLVAGIIFQMVQRSLRNGMASIVRSIPPAVFFFSIVVILGLLSSVITAIIASLVLVEIVNALPLDRKNKVTLIIIACFAIGLGAVLTPIGEPLATIATSKMGEGFNYLFRMLSIFIIPGVIVLGIFAALRVKLQSATDSGAERDEHGESGEKEGTKDVVIRALKVYLFVMALVLLGEGFKPLIETYILGLPNSALYWINMVSAVLDNATLTAAELSPKMSEATVKTILMGLLISGGMLIPGNIPNIISAGKLKIGSQEWARLGVPMGLVLMVVYFIILEVL